MKRTNAQHTPEPAALSTIWKCLAALAAVFAVFAALAAICGCSAPPVTRSPERWKCVRIYSGERSYTPAEWNRQKGVRE